MRYLIFALLLSCTPVEPMPTKADAATTLSDLYCAGHPDCIKAVISSWCGAAGCQGNVTDRALLDTCVAETIECYTPDACLALFTVDP